jgi:hypothetical protein
MEPTEFRTGVIRPIECTREAWNLIKPNYWLLLAIFIVGAMVGAVTLYILIGAMISGIIRCYLNQIDGRPVRFDDLWTGIKLFWPSLPVTILVVIPAVAWVLVLFVTIYLPILMMAMMGERIRGDDVMTFGAGAFVVDFVVAIVMICFHTLLTFSFPLIVDRGLTGLTPAVVSAKAVLKNMKGIGGLICVNFVLALAGQLAFCVGIYLVIPLIMTTSLVAYRKVFPALDPPHLEPPPPNVYSGVS